MADSLRLIAKRLVDTREALGYSSQAEFCKDLGVEKNVYNPFEKGRRRISLDVALKLREKFGIPLDWAYCGDPSNLPTKVFKALQRAA